jgi:hypothetical protein
MPISSLGVVRGGCTLWAAGRPPEQSGGLALSAPPRINERITSSERQPNTRQASDHAIAKGWLWLHESGTFVKFTEA